MKKPTKSTTRKSAVPKHSKSSAKPVTIDLKAEKVVTNEVEKQPKTSAKSSTSKTDAKATASEPQSIPPTSLGRGGAKPTKSAEPNKSTADTETNRPLNAAPQRETGTSSGKFAAAVIGGIVALAGATLLQTTGIMSAGSSSSQNDTTITAALQQSNDELSAKIEALEKQMGSTTSANDITAIIDKKFANLQTDDKPSVALDEVTTQVNETTIRVEKLQAEVASISNSIAELKSSTSTSAVGGDIATTSFLTKLEEVSQKLNSQSSDIDALRSRTAELTTQVANTPDGLKTTRKTIADLQVSVTEQLDGIVKDATSLSQSIHKVQKQAEINKQANNEVAKSIAAAIVKNDIDSGNPFTRSLGVLSSLSPGDETLKLLEDYADSGVPTAGQLSKTFASIKPALLSSLAETPADDLTSRLLAGAKSMVKVESLNPDVSDNPSAPITQIEAALINSDLIAAEKSWAKLPRQAKDVSLGWHKDIRARIAVNGLISKTLQSYLLSTASQ